MSSLQPATTAQPHIPHPFCCPKIHPITPSHTHTPFSHLAFLLASILLFARVLPSPPNLVTKLLATSYIIKLEEIHHGNLFGSRYFLREKRGGRQDVFYGVYVDVLDEMGGEKEWVQWDGYVKFRCEMHVDRFWICGALLRKDVGEVVRKGGKREGVKRMVYPVREACVEGEGDVVSTVTENGSAVEEEMNVGERVEEC